MPDALWTVQIGLRPNTTTCRMPYCPLFLLLHPNQLKINFQMSPTKIHYVLFLRSIPPIIWLSSFAGNWMAVWVWPPYRIQRSSIAGALGIFHRPQMSRTMPTAAGDGEAGGVKCHTDAQTHENIISMLVRSIVRERAQAHNRDEKRHTILHSMSPNVAQCCHKTNGF